LPFGKGVWKMDKAEIRAIVENRFCELGAEKVELHPSGDCWTFHGAFFKVTTLQDFWVLEWTDNRSCASNYCFEDVDPMPYNISEHEIIQYIDGVLQR
jgi:hypothetical protein